jgi:hypothetical protein
MRGSIAMLPGAAARAPMKQDSDVRPREAATKVRTPFRQTSDAILKAAFAFGGQPVTVTRGNEPTNYRTQPARLCFPVRLVTKKGTTFGADTQLKSFASAPVGGTVGVTNRLILDEAKQARCWHEACRCSNAPCQ